MNKLLKAFIIAVISVIGLIVLGFAVYGMISMVDDLSGNSRDTYSSAGMDDSSSSNPFEDNDSQQDNPFDQPDQDNGNQFPENDGNNLPGGLTNPAANPSKYKLGIIVSAVTDEIKSANSNIPYGLIIIGIEDTSSLANTQVQIYDVITKVDGQDITSTDQLHNLMDQKNAGDKLTLTIARPGSSGDVEYYEIDAVLQVNETYNEDSSGNTSSDLGRPTL